MLRRRAGLGVAARLGHRGEGGGQGGGIRRRQRLLPQVLRRQAHPTRGMESANRLRLPAAAGRRDNPGSAATPRSRPAPAWTLPRSVGCGALHTGRRRDPSPPSPPPAHTREAPPRQRRGPQARPGGRRGRGEQAGGRAGGAQRRRCWTASEREARAGEDLRHVRRSSTVRQPRPIPAPAAEHGQPALRLPQSQESVSRRAARQRPPNLHHGAPPLQQRRLPLASVPLPLAEEGGQGTWRQQEQARPQAAPAACGRSGMGWWAGRAWRGERKPAGCSSSSSLNLQMLHTCFGGAARRGPWPSDGASGQPTPAGCRRRRRMAPGRRCGLRAGCSARH